MMDETTHDFGEWRAQPATDPDWPVADVNILREDGLAVAVAVQNGDITAEEALAHGRLIATAPKLLKALRGLVRLADKPAQAFRDLADVETQCRAAWDEAREAVAQAVGEAANG
jgi:hypothetical protein